MYAGHRPAPGFCAPLNSASIMEFAHMPVSKRLEPLGGLDE
jgi:hypothetical protein